MGLAGAAVAINRDLQRMMAERIAAQEMARRAQMEQERLKLDQQRVSESSRQFDAGLSLDRDQFGFQQQQWGDQAPARQAGVLHTTTQTRDLEQKPLYAEAERQANEAAAAQGHKYNIAEIAEGGRQSRMTQAARPSAAATDPNAQSAYVDERQGRLKDAVTEAKGMVGTWTAGLGGKIASLKPGSGAIDLAAKLDQIAANIAFTELQEMRNASKTGGALGAVSERELSLLSSVLGSLRQDQSPESLTKALDDILGSLDRWEQAKSGSSANRPGGIRVISIEEVK